MFKRSHRVIAVFAALAATVALLVWRLVLYCPSFVEIQPGDYSGWGVVLITVDTLRADHLGCHGYPGIQTPNIDRLSREGAFFTNASVSIPRTGPSHASILSGLRPENHGVVMNTHKVPRKLTTLAKLAKKWGYDTAAFVSSWILDSKFRFNIGFNKYDDGEFGRVDKKSMIHAERLHQLSRRGDETMTLAQRWLEKNEGGKPDFVWIHLWDVHEPYVAPDVYKNMYLGRDGPVPEGYLDPRSLGSAALPPGEVRPSSAEKLMRMYDGEISYVDHLMGPFFDYLRKRRDKTIVVFTADHGESFEHGAYRQHGSILYNSTLHVPLIIWSPDKSFESRWDEQVESVDIAPTLAFLLGWDEMEVDGRNLFGPERHFRSTAHAVTHATIRFHDMGHDWALIREVDGVRYKLMDLDLRSDVMKKHGDKLTISRALYDLDMDPAETVNLLEGNKEIISMMEAEYALRSTPRPNTFFRAGKKKKDQKGWEVIFASGVEKLRKKGEITYAFSTALPTDNTGENRAGIRNSGAFRARDSSLVFDGWIDEGATLGVDLHLDGGGLVTVKSRENNVEISFSGSEEEKESTSGEAPVSDQVIHSWEIDFLQDRMVVWVDSSEVVSLDIAGLSERARRLEIFAGVGKVRLTNPCLVDSESLKEGKMSKQDLERLKALGYIQ